MKIQLPIVKCTLVTLLFVSSFNAYPQEEGPITKFDVVGNIDSQIIPGERIRIAVKTQAVGTGTLQLRIRGAQPPFISQWDEKQVECFGECQIEDTLFVNPTRLDYGKFTFNLFSEFLENQVIVDAKSRRVRTSVAPQMRAEPPYTGGTANKLCWKPFESNFDYELVKLLVANKSKGTGQISSLLRSQMNIDSCDVVENLPEGSRFAYYVLASESGEQTQLRSNVVYSEQDQTPPPATAVEQFSVSESGVVRLSWRFKPDAISYIDRYVIHRKQVNVTDVFTPVDTISFYPAKVVEPINYYPALAQTGDHVYVDFSDSLFAAEVGKVFTLGNLPPELRGTALIKTAINDRWNEGRDFLKFELFSESEIYVAYDVDNRNISEPDWLNESFIQSGNSVDVSGRNLRLYKSKDSYAAGEVVLGGNFAQGANMENKEPMMYLVFVKPVRHSLPFVAENWIQFEDSLGLEHDLNSFKYKLTTIDAVGNVAVGQESPPVVLDLNKHCQAQPTDWFIFQNGEGTRFGKGFSNEVCILDPVFDSNCLGFRDTDSLRFQAVRESVRLFGEASQSDFGVRFFDSGWIRTDDLSKSFCYRFDLLPQQFEPDFVNGKRYFFRVQSKDQFGNVGAWSDTVSAVQDVFPPDDVKSLIVESIRFSDGNRACNQLKWTGAQDFVSGIKSFVIYRKDFSDPGSFTAIDTISGTATSYCDTLDNFDMNKVVTYKVGSIDNVGNLRTADESNRAASIRVFLGPVVTVDSTGIIVCPVGRSRITSDSLSVSWADFDNTDVSGYEVEVTKPAGELSKKFIFDPDLQHLMLPLDSGDGIYRFRVRAFYATRDTTIYSNIISIRKKLALAGIENLTAIQDTRPTGDILLKWSHRDLDEIEQFEIFNWKEGESRPSEPSFVVPGDTDVWVHDAGENQLVAYECNYYAVRARDCFGLVSDLNVTTTAYSANPPVFLEEKTQIGADSIEVCWSRPVPRFKMDDAFEAIMVVYEDSLSSIPIDSVSFINDTCYVLYNPLPGHNYIFKVKEIILDDLGQGCSERFESTFSRTLIVPFENRPSVVNFQVQALPIHPDSTAGSVFVSWQGFSDPAVTHFILKYYPVAQQDDVKAVSVVADTFLVTGLDITKQYAFELISIDSLGQESATTERKQADFNPRWLFTPKIVDVSPTCFRDSVTVFWDWVDENLAGLSDNRGADSIFVEFSIDTNFVFKKTLKRLYVKKSHTFYRNTDFPFVNDQNDQLYIRIRAKDRWQHFSPWSSTFNELGVATGAYDEVPPEIVRCSVDSVKAPLFGSPNQVDVYLSWPGVADNCSGTAFYQVVRNDSVIAVVDQPDSLLTYVDHSVAVDEALVSMKWEIFPSDNVGNRQPVAQAAQVPLVLTAPDSGWCVDDTTFCWEPAIANIPSLSVAYFVEGARFPSLLGNPITNIVAGPLRTPCYRFDAPWEGIYWRVKARVGNFESAWSDTIFCELNQPDVLTSLLTQTSLPEQFNLQPNFPNPFNPSTTIRYDIPASAGKPSQVKLIIYNMKGQKVRTLVNSPQGPGEYLVSWDGRDDGLRPVGSGVYVYRIQVRDFTASHKMIFVK